jgi:gliding motility-associated-like protein
MLFLSGLATSMIQAQGTQPLQVFQPPAEQFLQYIQDSLLFGGGQLSQPEYFGVSDGRGVFQDGADIGFQKGIILSSGWVMATTQVDGGDNKNGAQASERDSLGPRMGHGGPNGTGLFDNDMNRLLGILDGDNKPDTAVDPSTIQFKFKPYYNTIKLDYVFASEEYMWDGGINPGGGVADIDLTGEDLSDFMGAFVKRSPGDLNPGIISVVGNDQGPGSPPKVPVCVYWVNHDRLEVYYEPNRGASFIFDGYTKPQVVDVTSMAFAITPCVTYWMKVGVADFPNGIVVQERDLSHQMNSAVFIEAFSLMSGYGLEWTLDYAVTNNEFAADTGIVEGGCSDLVLTLKTNVMPLDSVFVRLRIDAADFSEYTITPPLLFDSLMVIPDSISEVSYIISPIDDNVNEGTGGIEKWNIRYQMDPCDVPTPDTSGFGTATQGYSGEIRVNVYDYNPYVNTSKPYGPDPATIYHCGAQVPVTITDITTEGIPPYTYLWTNPPQFYQGEVFTTTINDSPDYILCRITDRCTGVTPAYVEGADTVIIYSQLTVQGSPSVQLCEQGEVTISVQNTNVGTNFTNVWYFEGNPIVPPATGPTYVVSWADYGNLAPADLHFSCHVTDDCGNTATDDILVTFYAIAEITGPQLICIGDPIQLTCTDAQTYRWFRQDNPSVTIGSAQTLNYTPPAPGDHTICVQILNNCGEIVETCYTFNVSQLTCDMTLDNGNDFNVCPNVPFTLQELNAYDGWQWTWTDNGGQAYSQTGLREIQISLHDSGPHQVQVIAYNIHGCYDTLVRTVTVYPYAQPVATTEHTSVCLDYPTELGAYPNGPVSINGYFWTANPADNSLLGQQANANPVVTPQQTTVYQCKILDNNGCYDSTTVTVNVRPRIAGQILANPGFACTDKQVQLEFSPIIAPLGNATYYWNLDGGNPPSSSQLQPSVIWTTPETKNIQLTISEPGCEETFNLTFAVYADPVAGFTATGNTGCQPIEVYFTDQSLNLETPQYLWDFGDGTTSTAQAPSHLYEVPGRYDVTLTVTNSTGCTNTLTMSDIVEVYEVPVADFGADPQAATIDNPTIRFTETINIPFSIIEWDFGDGNTNSENDPSPRHTYGAPGSYLVVMYTETEFGCWDRDTLEIGILEDIKIFVPNAFSPNGDGRNDCFSVGGTTGDIIEVFQVIIFSQWGQQVYESKITDPDCVWDGRNQDGALVEPDSYVYRIYGKNYRGAKKVYEGIVTIVK